jgi:hypothetical protein
MAMRIIFQDYPGGWLEKNQRKVQQLLLGASVILVAIDTPAMMELEEHLHERVNLPTTISHLLGTALNEKNDMDRIVIFVPMRCEKWVRDPRKWGDVEERFREHFQKPIRTLEGHKGRVATVFCPIQTLGSVEFSRYPKEAIQDGIAAWPDFVKSGERYAPVDCEQPLRFALQLMFSVLKKDARNEGASLEAIISNRTTWVRMKWVLKSRLFNVQDTEKENLKQWMARASELLKLTNEFAKETKESPPFRILQRGGLM